MNRCRPQNKDKKTLENVEKSPQTSRKRRAAKGWIVEEVQEAKGGIRSWRCQKRLWEVAKKRMLDDRGALLSEEGNIIREYRANTRNIFSVVGTRRLKKKNVKVGA